MSNKGPEAALNAQIRRQSSFKSLFDLIWAIQNLVRLFGEKTNSSALSE